MTQKLAKTFKQLNEMSNQLLKSISPTLKNDKNRNKNKQKQRVQDLNSNLINGDDQQINGINSRKKVKANNRMIQEAEEDVQQQNRVEQKAVQKSNRKNPQKNQKKNQTQLQQNKKKAKVISHKPKAPTSSFLLFFKQQQHSIAKSYPNYGVVQLTKVAAKCWNDLSIEDKQPYIKMFEQERKKYQEQMEKYRRQFPEQVRQKQLQKKQRKKKKAKQRRQREVKQPKQKTIPINSNNDPHLYHQITPGGSGAVKIQHRADEYVNDKQHQNMEDLKNEEQGSDGNASQVEDNSESENSLGEDI